MQTIFRSVLILVLLANFCAPLCAQTVGMFDDLWNALYGSGTGTSITLSKDLNDTMTGGFAPTPSNPMRRDVTINTGGHKINYKPASGDEEFWFFIGGDETLTFSGNADISGGNLGDSLFYVDVPVGSTGGKLIFNNNANLHDNIGVFSGAVYLADGGTLSIAGYATFKNNYSEGEGGAVYASESAVDIAKITAEGNHAVADGGVFFVDSNSTVTISKGATFTNNSAGYDIYDTNGDLISNGDIGSGNGGAAYVTIDATMNFTGTGETVLFNSNKAADYGGALYIDSDGSVTFDNNTVEFLNNYVGNSGGEGGAVYLDTGILTFDSNVDNLKFEDNEAKDGNGGAMSVNDGVVNFDAKTIIFQNNTANSVSSDGYGGAIYAAGGDTRLEFAAGTTTNFTNNESGGDGGAVYLNGVGDFSDLDNIIYGWKSLGAVHFANNEATGNGGGLYAEASAMQFSDVTFLNNKATGDGGAIFADGSYIAFTGTTSITNNTAANGGALALSNDAIISFNADSSITNNTAITGGGAIYASGNATVQVDTGKTLTLTGNSAAQGGAIFVADGAELILQTAANATLKVSERTGSTENDVYIDENGILTLSTEAGSTIRIESELSSHANGADITKTGVGAAYLDGNVSLFIGTLTVDEGNLYISKSGTNFAGDVTASGGTVHLAAGVTLGNLTTKDTTLDLAGGNMIINTGDSNLNAVSASVDNINFTSTSILYIALHGEEEVKVIEFYNDTGFDGSDKASSQFNDWIIGSEIVWQLDNGFNVDNWNVKNGSVTDSSILVVSSKYDANGAADWTFNTDAKLTKAVLNNNVSPNTGKKITVNNGATLTLDNKNSNNNAGSLNGTGNVAIGTGTNLTLNGSTVATLDGDVTGDGDLIMDGNFTQKIKGDIGVNLDIKKGTIAVADGEMTGDLTGSSSGTFLVDGTTIVQGGIEDSYFKITGDTNDFEGKTTINSGWLLIESDQFAKSNEITVGANGGLGGHGTIGGTSGVTVKNGGAIQAYEGNLNVDGMLTFESGGQLYLIAAGSGSHVISANSVKIAAGAKLVIADVVSSYTGGKFKFVESSNIDGSFDDTSYSKTTGGTEWTFTVSKDGTGLWVNGTSRGVTSSVPGLSWNQGQVVKGLSNGGPALEAFITDLNNNHRTDLGGGKFEYDAVYQKATQQLAGASRLNSLQFGLYSPHRTVFNRLQSRELYGSDPIYYDEGYDYDPAEGYGPVEGMEGIGAGAAEDSTYRGQAGIYNPHCIDEAAIGCDPCASVAIMGDRRFWADVTHIQTKARTDGNSSRYGISRTGLLIGMDHQKTGDTRIGSLFGYFAPYLWQDSDRIEADDYHFGMYFQKQRLGTEFYGYLGYAHQEISSSRYIDVSAVDGSAPSRYTGNTSGNSFLMNFEISKPRYYGSNMVVRPLIGLDYYYTSQNGFAEDGAGIFGLRYDRANYDQLFLRFGMNFKAETFRSSKTFRIQYINQVGGQAYPDSVSYFVGGNGTSMNIRGVNLGHDYLNLGFGLNVFRDPALNRSLSFDYDANMSRRMTSHGVSLIYMKKF